MAIDRLSPRLAVTAAACALACMAPGVSHAAADASSSALRAGTMEVPLNKSAVISVDRPIAKVMVGSDKIADVLPLTDRSIYVLGKSMGTTSVTLYDSRGLVLSVVDVSVGPDVEALTAQLRQLIPGEPIQARISNDSIVLTGMVNNPGAVDRAVQIAKTYAGDKVVNLITVGSSQQVMLEVRFAEVDRSADREIGVGGYGTNGTGRFGGVVGNGSGFVPGTPGTLSQTLDAAGNVIDQSISGGTAAYLSSTGIQNQFGVFRQAFSIGGVTLNALVNGLEARGFAKTLAQPTLLALSGEKADFLAGGEFPVPVVQSGNSGGTNGTSAITVQFKPFGVSLGFTPTVLSDKTINLVVEPEVSEIDPTASITLNGITIPGIRTRRASTTLELRDGESFAIAGLLQNDHKVSISQLPVLGSIPILGALFRSTKFQKGQTELLIVVTPHLVAPIKPGQVRLPTDRVEDPNEAETFLMGKPYRPKPLPPIGGIPAISADGTQPADGKTQSDATPAKKDDGYAY